MNDWIADYNDFSGFKDVSDVLEDALKLRGLYWERRIEEMYQHIRLLTVKLYETVRNKQSGSRKKKTNLSR